MEQKRTLGHVNFPVKTQCSLVPLLELSTALKVGQLYLILLIAVKLIFVFVPCVVLSQCYSEGQYQLGNANTTYLFDGSYRVTGRIEVCTNSTYNSVCDYGWDDVDALVFCRNYFFNNLGISSSNISELI